MDYERQEIVGMCAAGVIGAGLGMLSYTYKKEIGVLLIGSVAKIEVVMEAWLKRYIGTVDTQTGRVNNG